MVELYPFRYRDRLTGRWVNARYKAPRDEIAERYEEWEIVGPPEMRSPIGEYFSPHRVSAHAEMKRLTEPAPVLNPHLLRPPEIDAVERSLAAIFLRRYIAYCARRSYYSQMEGAAALYREVSASP